MPCIFIVENHNWVRDALSRMLSLDPGLEICGAVPSAEEALELLPAGADLVLIDVGLDGMSGLDLLKIIRERWPELPCVILTNHPAETHEKIALEAGAMAYIEKGDAPALLSAIESAVSS
jgi:DNA-binding NarL/FixJ family response regulator